MSNSFKSKVNIDDLGYCYAKVLESEANLKDKYKGKVIVYFIIKDINAEKENKKLSGKGDEEIENYYKNNFDIKYEGGFNFCLPKLSELRDLANLIKNNLFELELDGVIEHGKNMRGNFYCSGRSVVTFFIDDDEGLGTNMYSHNAIFLNDGEYYKGDLKNFSKRGKGIYINKKGLRIEGYFIDDDTVDGIVDIYDKNYNIIKEKVKYNKAKIEDIFKEI